MWKFEATCNLWVEREIERKRMRGSDSGVSYADCGFRNERERERGRQGERERGRGSSTLLSVIHQCHLS